MRWSDDYLRASVLRPAVMLSALAFGASVVAAAESSSRPGVLASWPGAARVAPYSMVYYYLVDDAEQTRRRLETLRDLGVTRVHTLVYWWQADTLGGDYWKKCGYYADQIGEAYVRSLDHFVRACHDLGLRPSLRLGSFREFDGLWHPMDRSGSVERYAAWVRELAGRYRGRIDHYVIGDEENQPYAASGFDGSARHYFERMLVPLAKALRAGDPTARISACATSSSPATDWVLELIALGLPQHADGVACNLWYGLVEDLWEIEEFMARVRAVWPRAKFYANGVGYVDHRGLHDAYQAGVVAQTMFTLWDIGWDSAPYYLYAFSLTADTKQNFGLASLPDKDRPGEFSDAWRAYQAIAQTFDDRDRMRPPGFEVGLRQARAIRAADGTTIRLAPPRPVCRAFIRADGELLIYLAYRSFREPRDGRWDVILPARGWGGPERIPLLDYRRREPMRHRVEGDGLVVEDVPVGLGPTIIALRPRRALNR